MYSSQTIANRQALPGMSLKGLPGVTNIVPFLPSRFINWKMVDGRKVPVDPAGNAIDPHNPIYWKSEAEAKSSDLPVGFVLNGDGFAFLDIDKCASNGQWHPDAVNLFQQFPGAMNEVSQSGVGLHLIFRVDPAQFADKRRKFRHGEIQCEFYVDKRFIAFGPHGWTGNPHLEFTGVAAEIVPDAPPAPDTKLLEGTGPVAEWCGPADDDKLIEIMCGERLDIAAAFGDSATTRDLWEGNAEALARKYPSADGKGFDASSADQGLANKLAFYTGEDVERMDRLFRRSGLMRDKWNREDYRESTIRNAIAVTTNVYNNPRYASPTGEPQKWETVETLLAKYAFCPSRSKQVVPLVTNDANAGMSFDNFKKDNARFSAEGHNPVTLWLSSPGRLSVAGLQMRPDQPRPQYTERGETYINTYLPPDHSATGGTLDPVLRYLEHLIPDPVERHYFMCWLAYKYQNPHVPGPAILMIAHGTYGTGRGTLTNRLLPQLFGAQYVKKVSTGDLPGSKNGQAQFNDYMADSLVVTVDEVDGAHAPNHAAARALYDGLKELVDPAPRPIRVRRKFGSVGDEMTNASFVIATNYRNSIAIPANDRRFAVLSNGEQMPEAMRVEIHAWLDDPANVAAFARHLEAFDIGEYSPFNNPPVTDARRDVVEAGQSDLDRAITEVVENVFSEPVFTVAQINAAIIAELPHREWNLPDGWAEVARHLVQNRFPRVGVRHGKNWNISHHAKRKVAVYAKSPQAAGYWKTRDGLSRAVKQNDIIM